MAKTKTRKRNPSSGKARRKPLASRSTKASTNGATAGQSEKFDKDQQALIPDADERIEALEEVCQQFLSERDKRKAAKTAGDEALQKIGELLNEHALQIYKCNGEKFYIEPGAPTVKVVKLNQKR